MMLGKVAKLAILVILVMTVIFVFTSCEKLKTSNLKANYHFSNANRNFSDGLYRMAIEEYEKALEYNPELGEAYRFLGESHKSIYRPGVESPENMERAQKALKALTKAYELYPDDKEVIYSLGDMYDRMRNFEEAERLYLKIIEMEPGNMNNYYVVAEFYKRYAGGSEEEGKDEIEGKTPYQKAEEMYLRRIEADPESAQGYRYTARFYELPPRKDFDQANKFHRLRLKLEPDNAEVYLSIGVNRWLKAYGDPDLTNAQRISCAYDGVEALKRATELDPDYPEPYSWLSVVYQSVLVRLEPSKAQRHRAEGERNAARFLELRKREADRKRLEEELRTVE